MRTMKQSSGILLGLFLLLGSARADVLVLLHGYQSDADAWWDSGIAQQLQRAKWVYGGRLFDSRGVVTLDGPGINTPASDNEVQRSFYTVSLPSEARLWIQHDFFSAYMQMIRHWHPDEPVILVGHSAGGLVARLYMVRHPDAPVRGLITIATPHLGSHVANAAAFVSHSPVAMMTPMLGLDTLNRSQDLLNDLSADRPGTVLFWLNREPHPVADYVSVVRQGNGDMFVDSSSQDMRLVPALGIRAGVEMTEGGHSLQPSDGALLVELLDTMRKRRAL